MVKRRLLIFFGATLVVGVLAGVAWALVTPRPGYLVGDDLGASMSERELAGIFGADATFTLICTILGLAIGVVSWLWFHQQGWWVCVIAIAGASIVGVVTWQMGLLVSPHDFDQRLANASPGDEVAVDLELRALAALLVAPFMAILPVMLLSAFWPEGESDEKAPEPADQPVT